MFRRGHATLPVAALLAIAAPACDRAEPPAATATNQAPARIVSLSPAITSTVSLLGAGDQIVGRTPWCRAVPAEVAVAWDGISVDAERLVALRPTIILVQSTVSGGPREDVESIASGRGWTVQSWRLDRLEDVRAMIAGVGDALGGPAKSSAESMLARFDAACSRSSSVQSLGRVILLFGSDPPMAFGPGSYVDDLWRSLGGTNAIEQGAYPELTVEQVARLDPDWVVVVGSSRLADAVAHWPLAAARSGRILLASDPGLLEPGAAAIAAVEALRSAADAAIAAKGTKGRDP